MKRIICGSSAALLAMAATGTAVAKDAKPAASLWFNGTIITMDGPAPRTVDAVVARDGRIVFAGPQRKARAIAGKAAVTHDLKHATMLPGFIDAHSHFAVALQSAGGIDLSDPTLPAVTDAASLIATVRAEADRRQIPAGDWVVVWQYNEEALAERRHVTRTELDAAFPDRKVILLHVSLHGLVANSAALAAVGVTEDTPVPAGGIMPKGPDGKLSGLLFEGALFLIMPKLPQPTEAQKLAALDAAQTRYAREGFTHAQEGGTQLPDLKFLMSQPARDRLRIDLAALPFHSTLDWVLAQPDLKFGQYQGRFKLQGIKFVLDGSPQARTAYFTRDYARGSPGEGKHPWHGEPVMSETSFQDMARKVHARGWQIFTHANGDAAIDMALRGFDALGIKAVDNRRPVVIHSQFQRRDHLPAYARIGVGPAYFTNHTLYFADTHRTNFPAEVVDFISPLKAAADAGLHPSNHSDFPVTRLDPFTQLWSAMARTSLTGVVSGADQRLSAYAGLQALTTGPAWQVFEEDRKGRIKPGLLADFVVLDRNPLAVPVDAVRSIKVLETIKEGQTIWKR